MKKTMVGLIPQRVCVDCGHAFWPANGRQIRCGSSRVEGTCSNKHYNNIQKNLRREKLRAYQKEWYRKNREAKLVKFRAYYQKNKHKIAGKTRERQRPYIYKRKYGISVDDYAAMHEAQGGKCKVCGGSGIRRDKRNAHLSIDHCHTTGVVRGLLCLKCNLDLGVFERRLDQFSKYLGLEIKLVGSA